MADAVENTSHDPTEREREKGGDVRNSRGGAVPACWTPLMCASTPCVRGITVHPARDERHITRADVVGSRAAVAPVRDHVEFNIEGDPRADLWISSWHARPRAVHDGAGTGRGDHRQDGWSAQTSPRAS